MMLIPEAQRKGVSLPPPSRERNEIMKNAYQFVFAFSILCVLTACSTATAPAKSYQYNAAVEQNKVWAESFLTRISQQEGVKLINPQLAYKPIKHGYGCKPTADSQIKVHYEARVAQSGQIVDSSQARGRPADLPLDRMIKGWQQGIAYMAEGSIWELYVHPDLAYGTKGSPPSIPPNAALSFTVHLMKVGTCRHSFRRL